MVLVFPSSMTPKAEKDSWLNSLQSLSHKELVTSTVHIHISKLEPTGGFK